MSTLRPFEGQSVIGTRMVITNAGDGLSDALEIDPEEFPLGTELTVVIKCRVSKVRYEGVPKTASLVRVHTARAELATVVDGEATVDKLLDEQREKLDEAQAKKRIEGYQEPDHQPEKKARKSAAAKRQGLAAVPDADPAAQEPPAEPAMVPPDA